MPAEQVEAAAARRQAVLGRLAKPKGQVHHRQSATLSVVAYHSTWCIQCLYVLPCSLHSTDLRGPALTVTSMLGPTCVFTCTPSVSLLPTPGTGR